MYHMLVMLTHFGYEHVFAVACCYTFRKGNEALPRLNLNRALALMASAWSTCRGLFVALAERGRHAPQLPRRRMWRIHRICAALSDRSRDSAVFVSTGDTCHKRCRVVRARCSWHPGVAGLDGRWGALPSVARWALRRVHHHVDVQLGSGRPGVAWGMGWRRGIRCTHMRTLRRSSVHGRGCCIQSGLTCPTCWTREKVFERIVCVAGSIGSREASE